MSISQGYKPLDMGETPEEWDAVNLKDILSEITNGITAYQSDDKTDYPVTRIETISDGVINPDKVKFLVSISKHDLGKYRLRNGDILFSHINSVKHIAKTAIYEGNPPLLIHGMNQLLLRPNGEKVYPRFLLNLLKFEKMRNKFRSLAKKAINQASINQKEVGSVKIPLPPIPEQHKIASVLSTVDEAIQKTDEVIGKAEMLKRGLMQRLLTRGIGHTKFKQTELGEIPEGWELFRLGQNGICEIKYGSAKPKSEGKIPVIGSAGIYAYVGECLVDPPVLIVGRKGNAGAVYLCKQHCWPSDTTFYVKIVSRKLTPDFLFSILEMRRISGERAKTTLPSLTKDYLGDQLIPVPAIAEQQKITSILSTVSDAVQKEKQRMNRLEQLKKGLMQVLLTGRVRVKVA